MSLSEILDTLNCRLDPFRGIISKSKMPLAAALVGATLIARGPDAFAMRNEQEAVSLPEVVVTGDQANKPGAYNSKLIDNPKYNGPLLDVPQSATVVPTQVMDDQRATTLREVLHNVSGISMSAGEGGSQGDRLSIRGFSGNSDIFMDGMRNFGSYYRDPFNYEQVEVLKGSASVMFGRGSTGGIINQESKKAQIEDITEGSLSGGSDATRRMTLDVNRQVKTLGENTHFRMNMMGHNAGQAGREETEYRRFGMAPSLAMGLGTPNRTYISYLHQSSNDMPDYGIPFLFNEPASVDRKNYYGFSDANFYETDVDVFTVRVENDLSPNMTLRNQMRYGTYYRNIQATSARVPSSTTVGTDINTINVTRNQIAAKSTESAFDYDVNLTTKFDTMGLKHTLVSGFEVIHERSSPVRFSFSNVPDTSLVTPVEVPFTGTGTVNTITHSYALTLAPYLVDTLDLTDKWKVIGGLRYDYIESESRRSGNSSFDLTRYDNLLSWRAGVVYKPAANGSIYLNYGSSFNPSIESLSLSTSTADTDPEENHVLELGSKWELLEGKLSVGGAVFINEKTNARTPDPNDSTQNILAGNEKVQGAEIEVTGKITDKWQVFTTYTYLESEITESNTASEVGSRFPNTPYNTFSVWTTYSLPWKLEVGAGVRGMSNRIASTTVDTQTGLQKKVPGYVVADAMLKYRYSKEIDVQLNLYNLADKFYFDGIHPSHLNVAAGRSALLSTFFTF